MLGDRKKLLERGLLDLAATLKSIQLYPPSSPVVGEATERSLTSLQPLLDEGRLILEVHPNFLRVGEDEMGAGVPLIQQLASRLHAHGVARVHVDATLDADTFRLFNPDLFEGFSRMVGFYPPGTPVILKDRSRAIVYATNPSSRRQPHVLVVKSPEGERVDPAEHLDLTHTGPERQIEGVADGESLGIDPLDVL